MLKMQGWIQSIAFVIFFYMVPLTQFQIFVPSGTFSQSRSHIINDDILSELGNSWAKHIIRYVRQTLILHMGMLENNSV